MLVCCRMCFTICHLTVYYTIGFVFQIDCGNNGLDINNLTQTEILFLYLFYNDGTNYIASFNDGRIKIHSTECTIDSGVVTNDLG